MDFKFSVSNYFFFSYYYLATDSNLNDKTVSTIRGSEQTEFNNRVSQQKLSEGVAPFQ